MQFLDKLFQKDEVPLAVIEDPFLGRMTWSKEHKAWLGVFRGLHIALSYERKTTPTPALVGFAREALADPDWLLTSLECEKAKLAPQVPPGARDELAALKLRLVYFSFAKGKRFIFGEVEGGGDERSWRIMYRDGICEGLGFDT